MKWHQEKWVKVGVTELGNEDGERGEKVCSKDPFISQMGRGNQNHRIRLGTVENHGNMVKITAKTCHQITGPKSIIQSIKSI